MQKYHRAARAFKALLSHHIKIDSIYTFTDFAFLGQIYCFVCIIKVTLQLLHLLSSKKSHLQQILT